MDESIPFFQFQLLGTSDFSTAAATGGFGAVSRVISVNFSPNFATDRVIFAVGVTGTITVLAANVAGGNWLGAMAPATLATATTNVAKIFFPTDYSFTAAPRFFISFDGALTGVYWWIGSVTASTLTLLPPGGIPGLTGQIVSLDGVGSFSTANLMIGTNNKQVFTSTNGGATWYAPTKAPSGPLTPTIVIMKRDFLTSGTALAIVTPTQSVAYQTDESGISLTTDRGVIFNQISLLNSSIPATSSGLLGLALGPNYTFATGSRASTGGVVPGGSFTVTNTGVLGSGFTVTAPSGTGDQFTVTVAAVVPNAQQVALTVLTGGVSVATTGTVTAIGNTLYMFASSTATYTATADGTSATLTVNGSGIPGTPFSFLTFSIPTDSDGDAAYATTTNVGNDIGSVTFALPDDINAGFTFTSTTVGGGTLTGTATFTGTWAAGTVAFNNAGDTATFTATLAGEIVTPAAVVGLVAANATYFGATAGLFPAAITLTNAATNSVVTFTGTGVATLTATLTTGTGTFTWAGGVLTFGAFGQVVTIQNNTVTAVVISAVAPPAPAATTSIAGGFPVTSYTVTAQIPASTLYVNFIWRYDITNLVWDRVQFATGQPAPQDLMQLSATGNVLYAAQSGTQIVNKSLDNGQTWAPLTFNTPGAIYSILAVDATTIVAGGANVTYKSLFNGLWSTSAAFTSAMGNITSLAVSSTSAATIVAGGRTGRYAISTNTGDTWGAPSTAIAAFATFPMSVAFEDASTSVVYSVAAGAPGVYRGTTRVDNNAGVLDSNANAVVGSGSGIAAGMATGTGNKVVYAMDSSDNYASRITNQATSSTLAYTAGAIAPATGTSGALGMWVQAAAGKNILWSIFGGNSIRTYTDYLAVPVVVASPATGITAGEAKVSWTAAAVGTYTSTTAPITYQASITTGSTALKSPYTSAAAYTGTALTTTFSGLLPNTTYTVTVWVVVPVVSFGGTAAANYVTFTTGLDTPTQLTPANGAQFNQSLLNFSWTPVSGATGYELWLATTNNFTTATTTKATINTVGSNGAVVSDWAPAAALTENTVYYWQVRATGTTNSNWSTVWSFSVAPATKPPVTVIQTSTPAPTIILTVTNAPANPVPTIILTQQPVVTVTQAAPIPTPVYTLPQATIVLEQPEAATPAYIWIIVGVGALLTLAVIILIIRTRRVV
jgi:hypothetical protein